MSGTSPCGDLKELGFSPSLGGYTCVHVLFVFSVSGFFCFKSGRASSDKKIISKYAFLAL